MTTRRIPKAKSRIRTAALHDSKRIHFQLENPLSPGHMHLGLPRGQCLGGRKIQAESIKVGSCLWRTRACSVALRLVFSAAAPDLAGFVATLVFTADNLPPALHADSTASAPDNLHIVLVPEQAHLPGSLKRKKVAVQKTKSYRNPAQISHIMRTFSFFQCRDVVSDTGHALLRGKQRIL